MTGICWDCDREREVRDHRASGRLLCKTCADKRIPKKICAGCNKKKKISKRHDGKPYCLSCVQTKLKKGICADCGNFRALNYLNKNKERICCSCYKKGRETPTEECYYCERDRPVHFRFGVKPVCASCYKTEFYVGTCSFCEETNVTLVSRAKGLEVCVNCYKERLQPKEKCIHCKRELPVAYRTKTGKPVCKNCRARQLRKKKKREERRKKKVITGICFFCEREKRVKRSKAIGELACSRCYNIHLRSKEICSICGKEDITAKRNEAGESICPNCYDEHERPEPQQKEVRKCP